MTTPEERIKILEMVAQGSITAEQGAKLLEAVVSGIPTPAPAPAPEAPKFIEKEVKIMSDDPLQKAAAAGRRLRVIVQSKDGRERVNVNLPIRLMKFGLKMGGRFVDELKDIDDEMAVLMDALENDEMGKIVEVDDDEQHVEVYIE